MTQLQKYLSTRKDIALPTSFSNLKLCKVSLVKKLCTEILQDENVLYFVKTNHCTMFKGE